MSEHSGLIYTHYFGNLFTKFDIHSQNSSGLTLVGVVRKIEFLTLTRTDRKVQYILLIPDSGASSFGTVFVTVSWDVSELDGVLLLMLRLTTYKYFIEYLIT